MISKRVLAVMAALALCLTALPAAAAEDRQDELVRQLLEEVKALKARVGELESKLAQTSQAAEQAGQQAQEAQATSAHSLKMSEQAQKAKGEQVAGGLLSDAGKRLKIYGAIEVEGQYANLKPKNGPSSSVSDFTLATAEVFIEADINKYVKGLVHMLYEEGDTDPMNIDEAYILLGQTDDVPAYFLGGRMYPAIGLFETSMVSDPITQDMFETQATAAEVGWAQDWFNVGVGAFNADVHQYDDGADNTINTFYARAQFDAPEGALGKDVDLNFGLAYINNIAAGNLREGLLTEYDQIQDLVAGWSAMISAQYEMVAFTAEYISALDDFKAGELYPDDKLKPYAYSLELAFMPFDEWTFAARFEGAEGPTADKGSDMDTPDHRWGLTASWEFLEDTVLSVEYMRFEFDDESEEDCVTTQLAVGF
ncbi:LbtU family siderophore porin [Desulfarculus baarsii]|nr:LbtU family siderophore porin [Desulfarculus baarsii]